MDKSNDWPSVLKNCGSKKKGRGRRFKLADKTRANAREDLTTAALNA